MTPVAGCVPAAGRRRAPRSRRSLVRRPGLLVLKQPWPSMALTRRRPAVRDHVLRRRLLEPAARRPLLHTAAATTAVRVGPPWLAGLVGVGHPARTFAPVVLFWPAAVVSRKKHARRLFEHSLCSYGHLKARGATRTPTGSRAKPHGVGRGHNIGTAEVGPVVALPRERASPSTPSTRRAIDATRHRRRSPRPRSWASRTTSRARRSTPSSR